LLAQRSRASRLVEGHARPFFFSRSRGSLFFGSSEVAARHTAAAAEGKLFFRKVSQLAPNFSRLATRHRRQIQRLEYHRQKQKEAFCLVSPAAPGRLKMQKPDGVFSGHREFCL
jgi:hypothetical protein